MTLVDTHHGELGVMGVDALGVSRATWYRRRARADAGSGSLRLRSDPKRHPRRIGSDERARILAVLCEERFADLTPREVHAALLSEGTYLCSPSSMYRILRQNKAIRERRRITSHPRHEKPVLVATRPDQVWTWDVTRVPASGGGHYALHVVIDLYSRCVVAWRLARGESAALARDFTDEAVRSNGVDPRGLVVHSDRGTPMTAQPLSDLYLSLGIRKSLSRPRTSNDNAFSESQFKTLEYGPAWPDDLRPVETMVSASIPLVQPPSSSRVARALHAGRGPLRKASHARRRPAAGPRPRLDRAPRAIRPRQARREDRARRGLDQPTRTGSRQDHAAARGFVNECVCALNRSSQRLLGSDDLNERRIAWTQPDLGDSPTTSDATCGGGGGKGRRSRRSLRHCP